MANKASQLDQADETPRLLQNEFSLTNTRGYLNTASVGLPPRSAVEAAKNGFSEWETKPDWLRWEAVGEQCRAAFAELMNVSARDVALVGAAHVAAGIVAASFPTAKPGANIVLLRDEHQSALWPFLELEGRGYDIRLVEQSDLPNAIDRHTALVALSLVQSIDGTVIDLDSIAGHEAFVYVDGTQAAGVVDIPMDRIDVLAVSAYKWLHCPRGMAFMVLQGERCQELNPVLASWKAAPEPWGDPYGAPRTLTFDARRFDLSLPWLLAPPALASLQSLSEIGLRAIGQHCQDLAGACADELGLPRSGSGILAIPGADVNHVRQAKLQCSVRNGTVRFAFGLYNDHVDVKAAVQSIL